tara:strand:+ start:928 stop:1056 length:129 start_codon:yes stop_codon:yes gene_type:complete
VPDPQTGFLSDFVGVEHPVVQVRTRPTAVGRFRSADQESDVV